MITNRWLLDTSVLHHIQPVPAAQPDWTTAAWLTGLGTLTAVRTIGRAEAAARVHIPDSVRAELAVRLTR